MPFWKKIEISDYYTDYAFERVLAVKESVRFRFVVMSLVVTAALFAIALVALSLGFAALGRWAVYGFGGSCTAAVVWMVFLVLIRPRCPTCSKRMRRLYEEANGHDQLVFVCHACRLKGKSGVVVE